MYINLKCLLKQLDRSLNSLVDRVKACFANIQKIVENDENMKISFITCFFEAKFLRNGLGKTTLYEPMISHY